ncbi:MAG: ribosome maturation factor RimM [Syntrophales bacterium]|nr:ribosome maturation factor RimM [Syntrophales bacterium]
MEGFFEIGRIVKPHGLRGRLKVRSYLLEPEKILPRVREVVLSRAGEWQGVYGLKEWHRQGNFVVLEIEKIVDIEAAKALVGCLVWGEREYLEPLPEGEYYWCELIGMEVVTEEGEAIGLLRAVLPTGSNDVYVCTSETGEILIPAIADCIREVDRTSRRMVVRLLPGLR